MAVSVSLLPLTVQEHRPHSLHSPDAVWGQTNCSFDVWVEILHALGLEPLVAAAFAVAADFEGDQWTFYKYPPEDLLEAYGVDVHEMNPWRGVLDHVVGQLRRGRLMTVEADSFFLPDTYGVSYRRRHDKSTIVVNTIDVEARTLGYFHNSGYHELAGEDFDGVLRLGEHANPDELAPYTEIVRLEGLHRDPPEQQVAVGLGLLRKHLARRPEDNPVRRMADQVEQDTPWLQSTDPQRFHDYAFATVRQCGASAETSAAFCRWLAMLVPEHRGALLTAATAWRDVAGTAKTAQLKLARLARGRAGNLEETWEQMAARWSAAQAALDPLLAPR